MSVTFNYPRRKLFGSTATDDALPGARVEAFTNALDCIRDCARDNALDKRLNKGPGNAKGNDTT